MAGVATLAEDNFGKRFLDCLLDDHAPVEIAVSEYVNFPGPCPWLIPGAVVAVA